MSISTAIFVPDASVELPACEPNPDRLGTSSDDAEEAVNIDLWLTLSKPRNGQCAGRIAMSLLRSMSIQKAVDELITFGPRSGLGCLPFSKPKDGSTPKVRNEGDRLIAALESRLAQYQDQLRSVLSGTLKDYFDPNDGRFTERVERLIKQDGDLEKVIRTQMDVAPSDLRKR